MTKVLAIDVGTASVSAAIAEQNKESKFVICDVLRCKYDAADANASKALLINLEKIFSECSRSHCNIDKIQIGLSAPLCLQKTVSTETLRQNPNFPISKPELFQAIEILKNQFSQNQSAACDILETKIDGYTVLDPLGHKGRDLKIKANLLLISPSFKTFLKEMKDKFFPASEFKIFSDSFIVKQAVLKFLSPKNDFLILDVGGEVSTIGDFTLPFGLRTIERRMTSFLNISCDTAQSFLRRFSSGSLDYSKERVLDKILNFSAEVLRDTLKERLNQIHFGGTKELFLTGAGANFSQFLKISEKSSIAEVKALKAQSFGNSFLNLGPLSGGEDTVLAALISTYERV
ncbi:MAG: hypothetical protein AAB522_02810 [Patescibacteria group bacterium]|mgnify:FL=1